MVLSTAAKADGEKRRLERLGYVVTGILAADRRSSACASSWRRTCRGKVMAVISPEPGRL